MKVSDFRYNLPNRLIAQQPLPERDASRLMVVRREREEIEESVFSHLPELLDPGDLLVTNNTVVRPGRLRGRKSTGGAAEITLTGRTSQHAVWECLIRAKNPRPGTTLHLEGGVTARVMEKTPSTVRTSARAGAPLWLVKFEGDLEGALEKSGLPPLPPYIKRASGHDPSSDLRRYQTVYAEQGEAAAAPTAGLHFSPGLLEKIERSGIEITSIRLDVSYGTFAPVTADEVEDHHMHPERYELGEDAAEAINKARRRGSRVVAAGTTVVRTLEHCADTEGGVKASSGETDIFIRPGHQFRVVDAMVTNFHMPASTLIMLVAAFAGLDLVMKAYRLAVEKEFRFLSYGDAMLIL